MENFLDKLSSYNLLNNLFPGTIFCYLMNMLLEINLLNEDFIVNIFLFYFIGMIVSRIGSVVVEPTLKKIKFIIFADYSKYVTASRQDPKIDILSETNNTYRSILGVCITLLICKLYLYLINKIDFLIDYSAIIIIISIFILFAFAYRKQTSYIKRRVEKINQNKTEGAI